MPVFGILPNIEYPRGRVFQSTLFKRLAYVAALFDLVALALTNGALCHEYFSHHTNRTSVAVIVGYESDIVFTSNFNKTQTLWFHSFVRSPEPGTLCDRVTFNVGESFVTNTSLFKWEIQTIKQPTTGDAGIAYNGAVLDICDVDKMSYYHDVRIWTAGITAHIACRSRSGAEIVASTAMTFSAIFESTRTILQLVSTLSNHEPTNDKLKKM